MKLDWSLETTKTTGRMTLCEDGSNLIFGNNGDQVRILAIDDLGRNGSQSQRAWCVYEQVITMNLVSALVVTENSTKGRTRGTHTL